MIIENKKAYGIPKIKKLIIVIKNKINVSNKVPLTKFLTLSLILFASDEGIYLEINLLTTLLLVKKKKDIKNE
jgi:hypothetical protein